MNAAQARDFIRETFTQPFDRARFALFIRNLLNHVDESKAGRWTKPVIKEAFHGHVNHYERLATYTDPDGQALDILAVYLKKETTLERARTLQRNFVADYLATDRGQGKAAVLAAFISPDAENWRFSFIKREFAAALSEFGRVVVETELTPARRYSFLVGLHEATHTAQAQLVPLLCEDTKDPAIATVEAAFGIERVTQEFFEEYQALYFTTKAAVEQVLAANAHVRADFDAKDISPVDFSKKLLGQVVFLYFLQKKGWFGVARDAEWGTGPRDFLRRLFAKQVVPYQNFFNDILEPLFYEALAKERDADFYSRFECKIPFLNGGLFDPIRNYDWVHTDILLPDELFSNTEPTANGDAGTGILDMFDRYNFTVNEAEPLEKEVAIDPEMLGKVFENLLDVKDRKRKGSYYTPREIVHYMCEQSLCYYLETALDGACPRADLETFIRLGDQLAPYQEVREQGKCRDYPELPKSILDHSRELDHALEIITICDPAIGSGAFPVGMLMEIVRARWTLGHLPGMTEHKRYTLKRHAIQNCLYGVDVDPGAVDIAKLRLWLSLVVDEDDIRQIKPLPNLDYKIMQGNSLLDTYHGVPLFDASLLSDDAVETARQIEEIKRKITEWQRTLVDLHKAGQLSRVKRKEIELEVEKLKERLAGLNGGNGGKQKSVVRDTAIEDDFLVTSFAGSSMRKAEELRQLHADFFKTTSRQQRADMRKRLDDLEWEYIAASLREQGHKAEEKEVQKLRDRAAKPFFLWKLHFGEVFQERGGFDIVIGNPPYVRADVDEAHAKMRREIEESGFYDTLWEKWDLYVPFIERGYKFLKPGGVITYIVSDAFCHSKYAQKPQNWFLHNSRVLRLDFFSKLQIFDAAVRNVTFFFQRADGQMNKPERRVHEGDFGKVTMLGSDEQPKLTYRAFFPEDEGSLRFSGATVLLDGICYITKGMVVHADEDLARGEFELKDLVAEQQDKIHTKPFAEGKFLDRWLPRTHKWLEWGTKRAPGLFSRPTFRELYDVPEKLISVDMAAGMDQLRVVYDDGQLYHNHSAWSFIPWQSLAGVRNNSLKKAARYADEKPRPDLPRREELEKTSRRFEVKYLLAVMNSGVARTFLRAHRRSNIHLYPDDWKKLPIPDAMPEQQAPIVALVDQILADLRADRSADVSSLESQVDRLVADLYGVTTTRQTTTTARPRRPQEKDLKEYLRTESLPTLGAKYKYFSIGAVRSALKAAGRKTTGATLKLYLSELVAGFFVYDAGRGWYTFVKDEFDLDPQPTADLVALLESKYPNLDFACWSTAQVKHFTHLTLAKFVSFVHAERHNLGSVFEILRETGFDAYLDPSRGEAGKSFAVREKTVIVRPSIAGQPVKGKLATIEKILVDLYAERGALPLMDIAEYRRTFTNLVGARRVSVSALAMYAERRKIPVSDLFAEEEYTISTF